MIAKFCRVMVDFFIREKVFPEEEREVYQYGFELCVSSVIGLLLVLMIGFFSGKLWESVVFYIVFCFTRLFSGGYHAPTYLLCKLVFSLILILTLLLDRFLFGVEEYYWFVLYAYSFIIIGTFSPVEHHNKPLTAREKIKNKILSVLVTAIWLAVMLLFGNLESGLYHIVALTLFFVANLMLLGMFSERRKKR